MNERLFQHIWQFKLFNPLHLKTTRGEDLQIIHAGKFNTHAGPDFLEGQIKIGNTTLVGNIELHIRSSDWYKHKHQDDPNYQNIILHVVLIDDQPLKDIYFPTLELQPHLDNQIVANYEQLMHQTNPIACHAQIKDVPDIIFNSWLNRLIAIRWEDKLVEWETLWIHAGKDWRKLLYYRMAANFGFHVNRNAFLDLALNTDLQILSKHRNHIFQLEALLFGQANLLQNEDKDDYSVELEKEYHFLRRKYGISPISKGQWKFMRMRPANFPTVRIAQFAMLLHTSLDLFSKMMEIQKAEELFEILDIQASEYWDNHYRFAELSLDNHPKRLGKDAIHNILINTVAPLQFLYALLQGADHLRETSIELLQSLPAENNNIIREWKANGVIAKDALESQALIHLFNHYCTEKACLNCAIGHYLIKQK